MLWCQFGPNESWEDKEKKEAWSLIGDAEAHLHDTRAHPQLRAS